MNIQPVKADDNSEYYNGVKLPFDGFVNVNDIIKKRRSLRDAGFTDQDIIKAMSAPADRTKEKKS